MSDQDFSAMRAAMVSNQLRTNNVSDPRVVAAVESVARENFVPADRVALAYIDVPVPLGGGRNLNAPLVTGRLITEARLQDGAKVLVVGSATGYAAALLAQLTGNVTALEEDSALIAQAQSTIGSDARIKIVNGPLNQGWAPDAPYDAIIIDGAVEAIPEAIWGQLAEGGVITTGLVDQGLTRLAIGSSAGQGLFPFADAETATLPGFANPRGFVFQ